MFNSSYIMKMVSDIRNQKEVRCLLPSGDNFIIKSVFVDQMNECVKIRSTDNDVFVISYHAFATCADFKTEEDQFINFN